VLSKQLPAPGRSRGKNERPHANAQRYFPAGDGAGKDGAGSSL
jgi:hypothetical protein